MRINEIFSINENNTKSPAFVDYLHQAVENAQVGFWFEEGGCWGMALALYKKFRDLGYPAQLIVSYIKERPSHAMIESNGKYYDYTGETFQPDEIRRVSHDELFKIAKISGYDDISDTIEDARNIIDNASALSNEETIP